MAGLNAQDMQILGHYAEKGNRELYWNYLAQKSGNDGYGLLALGVVRNDNMPGAVANQYAQNQAQSVNGVRLTERQWDAFGQDLVQRDFALRQVHMENSRPGLALNLPAKDVQAAHDNAFSEAKITPDAWTPRQLLEAARRQGGEPAADQVWNNMLNSEKLGTVRLVDTLHATAWSHNDKELDAAAYVGRLTRATLEASHSRSYSDPNTVGATNFYRSYDAKENAWYTVNGAAMAAGGWGAIKRITDPALINELDDTRALRLEQQDKAKAFHPQDPFRSVAKSPRTLADAGPALEPGATTAGVQAAQTHAHAATPRDSIDAMFTRLTDAAMAKDMDGMRAVGRAYVASDDGQQWLRAGQEHNRAERQASEREIAHQAELQVPTHAPLEHRAPVMRM